MFTVNGMPILADEMQVIYKLRDDCTIAGINVFHRIRMSGKNNVMTTCPFHKNGQERKPSFGISTVDGTCHCFSCGWVGSLEEMISQVFGYNDDGGYGRRWLARNFLSLSIETRKPVEVSMARHKTRRRIINIPFTEEQLESYRFIHPYMYERGLTDELIEQFDVGYDKETQCLTFPCYYQDGSPAFIARRSVKTKFFNYPKEVKKPVYASHLFYQQDYKYAVICESIFNTLTCWKWGIPSVALLGTGAQEQYDVLRKLPVRKYILGLDPDEAGQKGKDRLRYYLGKYKLLTEYEIPKGKDINDLDGDVLNLREIF